MKLFTNVRVLAVEENSFKDKDTGATITFFKNYLKDESGAVVEMNSGRTDLREYEGKTGIATIELRNINDKWNPKFIAFTEGEELEAPEETIA